MVTFAKADVIALDLHDLQLANLLTGLSACNHLHCVDYQRILGTVLLIRLASLVEFFLCIKDEYSHVLF